MQRWMEVEMGSGLMVTTLHSACDSNVTGSDGHHLRSPHFNPNDEGGFLVSFPCSHLHSATFKTRHTKPAGR